MFPPTPTKSRGSEVPQSFTIHPSEIRLTELIGGGDYAKVYKGVCRGVDVAVKVFKNQSLSANSPWLREAEMIKNFNHPNICLFLGVCEQTPDLAIVTELMDGTLEQLLFRSPEVLPLATRLRFGLEIAQGLTWLHSCDPPVIHKDLKFENILRKGRVMKVADFGLSQFQQIREQKFSEGNALYRAPEVFRKQEITPKSDVYAFGIMIWELFMRKQAFDPQQTYNNFKRKICDENVRPIIPEDCPDLLRNLMTRCWAANPADRPPMTEVVDVLKDAINLVESLEFNQTIDKLIPDRLAAVFWKTNFMRKDSVSWSDLKQALYRFISPPPPSPPFVVPADPTDVRLAWDASSAEIECATMSQLQAYPTNGPKSQDVLECIERRSRANLYLTQSQSLPPTTTMDSRNLVCMKWLFCRILDSEPVPLPPVTLACFGNIATCFGPLDEHFIDRLQAVCSERYFYSWISSYEAAEMTNAAGEGAFLFRFSARSPPGSFVLTRSAGKEGRATHRVYSYNTQTQLFTDSETSAEYSSINQIIESNTVLKTPCQNSPLAWIYNGNETDDMQTD